MQVSLTLAALAVGLVSPADTTGRDVLESMHERYAGRWPNHVTFVQKSTFYEPQDKTREETWYESVEAPDRLRIDFAPIEDGNGLIFRSDSIYEFKADSLVAAGAQTHPLMVLSRTVYDVAPDSTAASLEELGFDLSKVREDTWQERPVYVVGAGPGDLSSAQFWIDKENLYFVRLLQPTKGDPAKIQEIQFNRYQRLGGGWIETEVVFMVDGKRGLLEEYSDLREGVDFEEGLFDPGRWGPPAWVEP